MINKKFKITQLKNYFLISCVLYSSFVIIGYLFAQNDPEWAKELIDKLMRDLGSLISPNPLIQFLLIFSHNLFSATIAVFAFFFFGIVSLISLFVNGIIIGVILNVFAKEVGLLTVTVLLLPHGIVELPAFFLSTALGLWLGIKFAKSFSPDHHFKQHFFFAFKVFLQIILPMFLLAALIESFITPWIFTLLQ